jgi:hypothetical protein
MKAQDDIVRFMERARGDPRIGPLHISLYLAIFYYSMRQDSEGPVMCSAKDLVALAKITGGTPYYRRMKQLHRYGYIVYEPSFNPAVKSRVSLVWDGGKA